MSYSPETPATEDGGVQMILIPGSGENNTSPGQETCSTRRSAASSWCKDKSYRRLAICSIICGISCIGIMALINSVKAEKTSDLERAEQYSRRARKFGIISIVVWVLILVLTPSLMLLISYLLTLMD